MIIYKALCAERHSNGIKIEVFGEKNQTRFYFVFPPRHICEFALTFSPRMYARMHTHLLNCTKVNFARSIERARMRREPISLRTADDEICLARAFDSFHVDSPRRLIMNEHGRTNILLLMYENARASYFNTNVSSSSTDLIF